MNKKAGQESLGRIVSSTGAQVIVLVERTDVDRSKMQIGQLVKAELEHSVVYGLISSLSIPMPAADGDSRELKLVQVDLIGERTVLENGLASRFRRGISVMPTLDDSVLVALHEDIEAVFASPSPHVVGVGTLHQDPRVRANISINDMLAKHFAVLGTTGAGKSCALTLILKRILEENRNAHILLLDPHGEYARAFGDSAEHLTAQTLELPYWLFTFEEFVQVVFGEEAKDLVVETLFLRELILQAKIRFVGPGKDTSRVTIDAPVPYSMGDLNRFLEDAIGKPDNRPNLHAYFRIKARLGSLQADRRFAFMFPRGVFVSDNLAQILGKILRVPVDNKPLSILDLAGMPSEVLNVVVSVLSRIAFDFAFWSNQEVPLLLVCEEAHRYAPQNNSLGFEPATRALARIAKEGRKYGISLCVVTQRPSELATSLLSQCNTVFAMRMSSVMDQEIISAALSEASSTLLNALPLLGTAEAIVVGEGVPIPMRIRFDDLPPGERPRSNSAPFTVEWQNDSKRRDLLDRVVMSWRYQQAEEA
jgi:DNA helicase HerA-like ATPase